LKLDPQVYEADEGGSIGAGVGSGGPGAGGAGSAVLGRVTVSTEAPIIKTDSGEVSHASRSNQVQNMGSNNFNGASGYIGEISTGKSPSVSNAITSGDSGVEAAASGEEVGDLFEYHIDQPITVSHDRSALIPILQTRMEGERVSVYNESVRKDRPMGGMRLKNTSSLTFEDGPITVIDSDAYAGEAVLQRFKPCETRFVSFTLDLATLVTVRLKDDREPVFMVRAVGGILEVHYHQTEQKGYTLTNQTDHPHTVYVEHPIQEGWELTDDTPKPAGKTSKLYRFRVELAPRQTTQLLVTQRHEAAEGFELTNLSRSDVELFVSRRYINDSMRAALDHIVEIKGRLSAIDARLAAIEAEDKEISEDQDRLRENIKALKDTSEARQLLSRYVSKADGQESRIEQLTTDRKNSVAERTRVQGELEAAIRALSIDHT
jgi:hypothetical protein